MNLGYDRDALHWTELLPGAGGGGGFSPASAGGIRNIIDGDGLNREQRAQYNSIADALGGDPSLYCQCGDPISIFLNNYKKSLANSNNQVNSFLDGNDSNNIFSPESDIDNFKENQRIIKRNTAAIEVLVNFTQFGQIERVTKNVISDIVKITRDDFNEQESAEVFSLIQDSLLALGITATTSEPRLMAATGLISTTLMTQSFASSFQNDMIYGPRIMEQNPTAYYNLTGIKIPTIYISTGGGFGGAGAGGTW